MNRERWQKVKSILADALEQNSPQDQTRLIGRSCGDDPELLREIETLMAEANAVDPLEECAENAAALAAEDVSDIGRRVGAYVITREIGCGGMGTVYLAARADGYFEKEVAIKVLNRGAATHELIRRFRAEREVLARLDHPNIARLMDAGAMDDGRPYFVMEYVEGIPITQYVKEKTLPLADRLQLFLKIAAAVELAHQNSVIHRDLKSNNILVNARGEPKLLDFGIAKVIRPKTDTLEITSFAHQRLTPMSASPEQVKGEPVTVLTDIYALGVVLYEMLTGVEPHQFETDHPVDDELVEVICKQLPVRPSLAVVDRQLERELRGDLDAVVLRALQKDPAARYRTVADFAEDVRCHLEGKPVLGRRTKAGYQIRKSILHDRRLRFAASLAALVLIGAFVAFLLQSVRNRGAAQPNDKVGIAVLPFDSFAADKENSYFADGVQEAILTNLANVSALKVISRGSVSRYRDGQKNEQDIGKALGVPYILEGTVQKKGDNVRVDAHLVDTRTAATIWAQQYDRSLDDLFGVQSELAQAIVSQLKAKLSPDEKAAIELTPTKDMLAYDLYLRGRESFLQNNFRKAVLLLEQAVDRDKQFALAYASLAEAHLYLYRLADDRTATRLDRANDAAETALRIAPKLAQSHLAKAQYFYYGVRDWQHALTELTTARSLGGDQAEFVDLGALIERRLGHWKDAIRDGERAIELDPQSPFVVDELIESYTCVRRFDDAERVAGKAIENGIVRGGRVWTWRTEALLALGRIDDARRVIENAPEDMTRFSEQVLASLYSHDFDRVEQLLAMAPPNERESYNAALTEGAVARVQGDSEKARALFQLARERILVKLSERPTDPELFSNLGLVDAGLGQKDRALEEAKKAVELCPVSRDAADGPGFQTRLAMVYAWIGDSDAAITELQKTVKLPNGPTWGELQFHPFWNEIRTHPQFGALLAEAAQPPIYN